MKEYREMGQKLEALGRELRPLLDRAGELPGFRGEQLDQWRRLLDEAEARTAAGQLRVAVVGSIKSGKSTFVNSLFGGDYLRRGAGVVTAIVTRIQKGDGLSAELFFKPWSRVNSEMRLALGHFPDAGFSAGEFDIRKEDHRAELRRVLDELQSDIRVSEDTLNGGMVLLDCFLTGYADAAGIVGDEPVSRRYADKAFPEHKAYAGQDHLAVYLDDLRLTIPGGKMDAAVEIADCQGADSPNPHHLIMIQRYLGTAHLLIYVISSRMGLRQADIRFLSAIRKMGLMGQTRFLLNIDLSEHESLDDFLRVRHKILQDLTALVPKPELASLSALYNLFAACESGLNARDRMRFIQWKNEGELIRYSTAESERFLEDMISRLGRDRLSVILSAHGARLGGICSAFSHQAAVHLDLLSRDAEAVSHILSGIAAHRKKAVHLQGVIKNALDGARRKLHIHLKKETDSFLDSRYGLAGETVKYMESHEIDYGAWGDQLAASGFHKTLYLVYQELQRGVDAYLAENVNPDIQRFVAEKDGEIGDWLLSVARPFSAMVAESLDAYNKTLDRFGLPPVREAEPAWEGEDAGIRFIAAIKEQAALTAPLAAAQFTCSPTARTEAAARLGWYETVRGLRRLFRKPAADAKETRTRAIRDGMDRIRRQSAEVIRFHFTDYRENLKYQYFCRLADRAAAALGDSLMDRFEALGQDLDQISSLMDKERAGRGDARECLKEIGGSLEKMEASLADLTRSMTAVCSGANHAGRRGRI